MNVLLCTCPFSKNMSYRLAIVGICICGTCGLQCTSKLEYFNFANWFHLWIVFFFTGKAACLNHLVFSSLGTTWCRNRRRRKKGWMDRKSLLAHRVLPQKNIFIQAQHLLPLYYCVIFHSLISNEVMVSAFQFVWVSRSSEWAGMPSQIQPWTYCFVEMCSSQTYQGWEGGTGELCYLWDLPHLEPFFWQGETAQRENQPPYCYIGHL